MRWRKWALVGFAALAAIGGPAYYWLTVESSLPEGRFEIDLEQVRKLAEEVPGEKVTEIRVEAVNKFEFPHRAIVAGAPWEKAEMVVYSYQLMFPGGYGLIDTAMDEKVGKAGGATDFYSQGWEAVNQAIPKANWILVTHEHYDHLGGLALQKELKPLFGKMKLTKEQLMPASRSSEAEFAPGALDGYQPLECGKYCAVAPGVVLIKAPGHTPGAQLIYVKRADGAEYLFLGDVAWWMENVDVIKERARLATWIMKEDRYAVLLQLKELNRLKKDEAGVQLVPGHDPKRMKELLGAKLLVEKFLP